MESTQKLVVALAGNPNCGKTALFNALTGSRQKVANYPGITVERKAGWLHTSKGRVLRVVDLPGLVSLDARTPDEVVARDVLLQRFENEDRPDLVVAVADATHLEQGLSLVLELKELETPVVLALNMMDLAKKRGLHLDLNVLERELGLPVIPTIATKTSGIQSLVEALDAFVDRSLEKERTGNPILALGEETPERIQRRFRRVDELLRAATLRPIAPSTGTQRLDRVLLHPVWGLVILSGAMLLVFQAVFSWAGFFQHQIESGIGLLASLLGTHLPDGALRDLLVEGVLGGVGSVLVFLPQILLLFFFILLLEDAGYMARAAFLLDRLMGRVGLHGRSFVPLLSSFACAIPGVMATRTIENRRDRLLTILVAPLMTCSARIPVYVLLVSAFVPEGKVWGFLGVRGLVLFSLYLLGMLFAFFFASVFRRTVLSGPQAPLILEMPTYKWPHLRNLWQGLWQRTSIFLRRAGTLILSLSLVLWFLASYPKVSDPSTLQGPAITQSYAGRIGHFLEPALRPLGFDWRISVALVPGFAAREVMVSGLATVFSIESGDENTTRAVLGSKLAGTWSLATALSLLLWYVFAPQCLSTFAVIRRETQSWGWTCFGFSYLLLSAYLASFAGYHLFCWLGWG